MLDWFLCSFFGHKNGSVRESGTPGFSHIMFCARCRKLIKARLLGSNAWIPVAD